MFSIFKLLIKRVMFWTSSPLIKYTGVKKDNLDKTFRNEKHQLVELRKFIEKNYEFVGENFSKKVREVYYDKKNKKAIYGTTTPEEREELAAEGIDLLSVPWVSKDN